MTDIKSHKQRLRERIWRRLEEEAADRFPGTRGRIPNFRGAAAAAERLEELAPWREAHSLKCNPDSPQLPVRKAALAAGRVVYMAVPRLRDPLPFLALDPERLEVPPARAASIKGASRYGRPVDLDDMPELDIVVAGAVAVSRDGARLGKGGGYSDLEFALAAQTGIVTPATLVLTTVHAAQIVPDGHIPMTPHDVPLDLIVTPDEVIRTTDGHDRPSGILWDELDPEKLESIPVLGRLRGAV